MTDDPFAVLGVARDATLDDVRAARRTLAMIHHPDLGGDAVRMQEVNIAFAAAVAHITGRRYLPASDSAPPPSRQAARRGRRIHQPVRRRIQYDAPSFTIDALPVESFEALLVVTTWMGEALVDDPPYLLEVLLHDPAPCWCRLELVPDAGGTTVSLVVAPVEGEPAPEADDVRDVWVANLNRLGSLPPET
jgi:hypothetical protein